MKFYMNVPTQKENYLRELSEKQYVILRAIYEYVFGPLHDEETEFPPQVHVFSPISDDFVFLIDDIDEDF